MGCVAGLGKRRSCSERALSNGLCGQVGQIVRQRVGDGQYPGGDFGRDRSIFKLKARSQQEQAYELLTVPDGKFAEIVVGGNQDAPHLKGSQSLLRVIEADFVLDDIEDVKSDSTQFANKMRRAALVSKYRR